MLVWGPDAPDTIVRSVPLPERTADNDVALGPAGTIYVTGGIGHGTSFRNVLYRRNLTGETLWQARVGRSAQDTGTFEIGVNSSLRSGPDGTLFLLAGMNSLPGGEQGWMPVATRGGRPVSVSNQLRRTSWPYQPVGNGLRLVSEVYTRQIDGAPHEVRLALVDRRGNVARAWRVISRTVINFRYIPELVGGNPVVVLDATRGMDSNFKWEYEVLSLSPRGTRSRFSLPRTVFGDNILPDVRFGPDGKLYELGSSPTTGVVISRYSLDSRRSS